MTEFQVPNVEVRTTVPGAEIQIGKFGVATNTRPCLVPEHVAQELAGAAEFDVGGHATSGGPIAPEDPSRALEEGAQEPAEPADSRAARSKARKGQKE